MDELPIIRWKVDIPFSAGRVIGVASYRGKTLIVCANCILEYEENFYTSAGHLQRLEIVDGDLWEATRNERSDDARQAHGDAKDT